MNHRVKIKQQNKNFIDTHSSVYIKLLEELEIANNKMDQNDVKWKNIINGFPKMKIEINEIKPSLKLKKSVMGMYTANIEINGKKCIILFDTGAEISVFTDSFLQTANITWDMINTIEVSSFNDSKDEMNVALVPNLQFGQIDVYNIPVLVIDNSKLRFGVLGTDIFKIDGIIGWDILQKLDFELDYNDLKFRIINDNNNEGAKILQNKFPTLILCDEFGNSTVYGLDTGARRSWISEKIITKYDLEITKTKEKTMKGAHGKEKFITKIIKEHEVFFYDFKVKFKNIETGYTKFLSDYEFDGVFGNDILDKKCLRVSNSLGTCKLVMK